MMKQTQSHARSISSVTWAIVIAVIIGGWLLSGQFSPAATKAGADAPQAGAAATATGGQITEIFKVSTRTIKAEQRVGQLIIRGQTKALARVHVRAETAGMVERISSRKGRLVEKGDLLCKLAIGAREATLAEAKAARAQAQSDFTSSNNLARKGYTAVARKMADKARLDAAKAAYIRAQLDLEHIEVKAPFRGIIEAQPAHPGDFLRQADICATLVQIDPILLTGAVSEQDVAKIRIGKSVDGRLVTGEVVKGEITFISPSSDTTTKTFTFEATVPNPDQAIRAGITSDITIDLEPETAHRIASSILSLDDAGRVGLRIVDANDIVRFQPVTILSNKKNTVWIDGLPAVARVITVGQEYVSDGQKVRPVSELPRRAGETITRSNGHAVTQ